MDITTYGLNLPRGRFSEYLLLLTPNASYFMLTLDVKWNLFYNGDLGWTWSSVWTNQKPEKWDFLWFGIAQTVLNT